MIFITIAEDHISLSDGLKVFLEQDSNIEVIGNAPNGKEMLEMLKFVKPQVVLTDINMPIMNGVELCTAIKSLNKNIKVIALSMYDNPGAIKEMIDAGADGYVLKISPLTELKKAIETVASGKNYFDQAIDLEEVNKKEQNDDVQPLSRSETEILKLIALGKTSAEIAEERQTAVSTVVKHRKNMIHKLQLEGKNELYKYALQRYGHYNQ
ncbi:MULTISPECIES: response regulator transcription factor [Nonlabens]|nr:response regulator transcription factor [Nonlabens ulvanivorans]KEZ93300.1 chemotaxis protein CheY [Nonlabens ulvanivorans]PRX13576.1 LuxR family two component transcriptional regulator [Nonlabens ulvanivorans]WOI23836.1 response regulator transcription factor [Nonlabens ulvanivorans]GAK77498.1 DNA-binding response regulator [Nonlabens ulvanivorans]